MAVIRFEPTSLISHLQDEIDRAFSARPGAAGSSEAASTWTAPVDITEYADRFELAVDLPGVDPDKVEITLEDGVLSISGERAPEARPSAAADTAEVRVRAERGHGRFYRRFVLPDTVDAERVQASGRHGVLEISIPKQPKSQPRRIKVAA